MERYAIPPDRLISARQKVLGEYDNLRDALVEGPANWMSGMYESATGKITELEADTPIGHLARYARDGLDLAEAEAPVRPSLMYGWTVPMAEWGLK